MVFAEADNPSNVPFISFSVIVVACVFPFVLDAFGAVVDVIVLTALALVVVLVKYSFLYRAVSEFAIAPDEF